MLMSSYTGQAVPAKRRADDVSTEANKRSCNSVALEHGDDEEGSELSQPALDCEAEDNLSVADANESMSDNELDDDSSSELDDEEVDDYVAFVNCDEVVSRYTQEEEESNVRRFEQMLKASIQDLKSLAARPMTRRPMQNAQLRYLDMELEELYKLIEPWHLRPYKVIAGGVVTPADVEFLRSHPELQPDSTTAITYLLQCPPQDPTSEVLVGFYSGMSAASKGGITRVRAHTSKKHRDAEQKKNVQKGQPPKTSYAYIDDPSTPKDVFPFCTTKGPLTVDRALLHVIEMLDHFMLGTFVWSPKTDDYTRSKNYGCIQFEKDFAPLNNSVPLEEYPYRQVKRHRSAAEKVEDNGICAMDNCQSKAGEYSHPDPTKASHICWGHYKLVKFGYCAMRCGRVADSRKNPISNQPGYVCEMCHIQYMKEKCAVEGCSNLRHTYVNHRPGGTGHTCTRCYRRWKRGLDDNFEAEDLDDTFETQETLGVPPLEAWVQDPMNDYPSRHRILALERQWLRIEDEDRRARNEEYALGWFQSSSLSA